MTYKICQDIQPANFACQAKLQHKVLIIAKDLPEVNHCKQSLIAEGYTVEAVNSGAEGIHLCQQEKPDLILIGWSIFDIPPLDFCRYLRSNSWHVPVIMLTASDSVSDRVSCLETGANDVLSNPFSFEELIARIQVQLRLPFQQNIHFLHFADVTLDLRARQVFRSKNPIQLTTKEFDLLEYFMSHPNQVVTRSQIIENVWGYDFSGISNVVEVYIRYLRIKLEEFNAKRLIHTVRGIGYVLKNYA